MKIQCYAAVFLGVACLGLAQASDTAPTADKKPAAAKKAKPGKIKLEGGDGSSMEKAIVITGAAGSEDGVPAEYDYLRKKYKNHQVLRQSLLSEKGRYYDVIYIKTSKGKEIAVYFDITGFFGK